MKTVPFKKLPTVLETYPKVLAYGANLHKNPLFKSILTRPSAKGNTLPDVGYEVSAFTADSDNLARYNKVCGFKENGFLPPTYLGVIAQRLQLSLMTREAFPFPLLGIVHVYNTITQHRPIAQYETLKLSCKFGDLRPHEKGQEFDFVTEAFDKQGELVYYSVNTYLNRDPKAATGSDKKPAEKKAKPAPASDDIHAIWHVPENIGRQYAAVSGDINFIHLHAAMAKAFGFPKAIAHGMWTKARVLSELGDFPDAFTVEASFKLPIFLPSDVELIATAHKDSADGLIDFALYDAKSDKPHLEGFLKAL